MTKKLKSPSRSEKKVNKGKGLFSNINFRSKRTQFIFTIAIFALVGGAWFTYRSFAATVVFTGTVANSGLRCQNTGSSDCISKAEPQKNNTQIISLSGNGTTTSLATLKLGSYKFCIVAKSNGAVAKFRILSGNGATLLDERVNIIGTEYKSYCSSRFTATTVFPATMINVSRTNGNSFQIANLTIEPVVTTGPVQDTTPKK